jgi:hypothetical protein
MKPVDRTATKKEGVVRIVENTSSIYTISMKMGPFVPRYRKCERSGQIKRNVDDGAIGWF